MAITAIKIGASASYLVPISLCFDYLNQARVLRELEGDFIVEVNS